MNSLALWADLIASVLFILSLKGLSHPKHAILGNKLGMIGMGLAITITLILSNLDNITLPLILLISGGLIGSIIALKVPMTAVPQLIAGFHSFVGTTAVLVAWLAYINPSAFGLNTTTSQAFSHLIELSFGLIIGGITLTGSVVAFLKLSGLLSGKPWHFKGRTLLNISLTLTTFIILLCFISHATPLRLATLLLLSLLLGLMLILPIGGADMPVVISMLNSYSGWAAAGIGLTLEQPLLTITGALVGASGAILSHIMCQSMNRSLIQVIFKGFHTIPATSHTLKEDRPIQTANAEDAAFLLENANHVIIVPGYGMAVSHAQHAVFELIQALKKKEVRVRFAIHPVAGRMPGHMNVLLAEANIPYEQVFEASEINDDFANTDVVLVIGANDITNPAAKMDSASPIYGMPILEVDKAKNVLFLKRTLAHGYAGVDNELFYEKNTWLLFGDAKKTIESILREVKTSR